MTLTIGGERDRALVARFTCLLALEPNWNSYGARAVDPRAVTTMCDVLRRCMTDETPLPDVVPLSGGGVQVEWHRAGMDLEIEADGELHFTTYYRDARTDVETDEIALSAEWLTDVLADMTRREQEQAA